MHPEVSPTQYAHVYTVSWLPPRLDHLAVVLVNISIIQLALFSFLAGHGDINIFGFIK